MGKKIKTLCKSKDMSKKNRETFVEIVSEPTHFCSKCLRVASAKEYLCKSEKLFDVKLIDLGFKRAE